MSIRTIMVHSIEEYTDAIESIKGVEKGEIWFRGQPRSAFDLGPYLYREDRCFETTDTHGRLIEPERRISNGRGQEVRFLPQFEILEMFKKEVTDNHLAPLSEMNDMEWLAFAQHFGMPTSLLDWSEDPLVGLYFAVEDIKPPRKRSDKASVYVLNPALFNEHSCKYPGPIEITNENYEYYIKYCQGIVGSNFPICIKTRKFFDRIRRQSGNFMLFSIQTQGLLGYHEDCLNNFLSIINIPFSSIRQIKESLAHMKIDEDYIMGDFNKVDAIAKKLREENDAAIKEIMNNITNKYFLNRDITES